MSETHRTLVECVMECDYPKCCNEQTIIVDSVQGVGALTLFHAYGWVTIGVRDYCPVHAHRFRGQP